MAFFLVDRDRAQGSLRLLSVDVFATREDALAALPGLVGQSDGEGRDVFVCDLDAATPVLFVPQPAKVEVAEEIEPVDVSAGEPETPDGDVGVWEAPGAESDSEPELEVADEVPPAAEGSGLADALRRAATSLESEGIVPPESVPAATALADDEAIAGDLEVEEIEPASEEVDFTAELSDAIASLGTAEPMSVAEESTEPEEAPTEAEADIDETVAEDTKGDWPWANVEQVEVVESVEEEEPTGSDESLIMPNPEAADFTPRPVIMGDYGDAPAVEEDDLDALIEAAVAEPEVDEVADEDASEPETGAGEESEGQSVETAPEPVSAEGVAESGYEAGDLELGDYTCDDCVYANTCPKAGSSSPAECGSFQWKSV